MGSYFRAVVKGLGRGLLVLWLVITLVHVGLFLAGGNPVELLMDNRLSQSQRTQLKEKFGYDASPLVQYRRYLAQTLRGDLGMSFIYRAPVLRVLIPRIGRSLLLGSMALGLAIFLALGLLWLLHHSRWTALRPWGDGMLQMLLAVPAFVWAPLCLAWFAYGLGWFPAHGSQTLFRDNANWWLVFWDTAWHAVLPGLCLGLPLAGQLAAYLNEQLRGLANAPFVLSAKGRGVSSRRVFWNHQMRMVLPSFVQWLGLYLPLLAGGAVVIEAIFGWPGLGLALFDAVLARDYPLLLGGCLWATLLVMPSYIIADWFRGRMSESLP